MRSISLTTLLVAALLAGVPAARGDVNLMPVSVSQPSVAGGCDWLDVGGASRS